MNYCKGVDEKVGVPWMSGREKMGCGRVCYVVCEKDRMHVGVWMYVDDFDM